MNVLILGSGGREHALAWKIKQSSKCKGLFVAPGNAGTTEIAHNISLDLADFEAIRKAAIDFSIDLVVVGPEVPLVEGIVDYFHDHSELNGIPIIGPGKSGARLEGSKDFSKDFMTRHGIPTATARTYDLNKLEDGLEYLESINGPYVLKADGLAAGKGVIISEDLETAKEEFKDMLANAKFGSASNKVVIEQFLQGIELSVFVLTDGKSYKILPEAKDYKRVGEGDQGLNTGGMGAVSPVHFAHLEFMQKVEDQVVKPTIKGLGKDGIGYKGFIFIGLMNVNGEPYVIEYNVRMGDPETQVVMPRIKSDLIDLLLDTWHGKLENSELETEDKACSTIVMTAGGYPEKYKKGDPITGLEHEAVDTMIFHAGTSSKENQIVTNGGRVLAVTALGNDLRSTLDKAYDRLSLISWNNANYRKDIGQDLLGLES